MSEKHIDFFIIIIYRMEEIILLFLLPKSGFIFLMPRC